MEILELATGVALGILMAASVVGLVAAIVVGLKDEHGDYGNGPFFLVLVGLVGVIGTGFIVWKVAQPYLGP